MAISENDGSFLRSCLEKLRGLFPSEVQCQGWGMGISWDGYLTGWWGQLKPIVVESIMGEEVESLGEGSCLCSVGSAGG